MTARANRSLRSPSSLQLQRQQLDEQLRNLPPLHTPRGGWIRTIRQALGMTMQQLGTRLGISAPSVLDLEAREKAETISVAKLRQAANALNCDLKIVFVPRPSLEATIRRQAALKAREERDRIVHTMRLEAQDEGLAVVLLEEKAIERWLSERTRRLWD